MLAYLYVVVAVLFRFLPVLGAVPFHFTPVGASLLYFGARRPARQMWFPVALLIASDLILTPFVYHLAIGLEQTVIWAWYCAAVALGSLLREKTNATRLVGASLAVSVSFFLLSNFAVWANGGMYPMTWQGLATCYTLALPFFRNTLIGDLMFSLMLFGMPALVRATRTRFAEAA